MRSSIYRYICTPNTLNASIKRCGAALRVSICVALLVFAGTSGAQADLLKVKSGQCLQVAGSGMSARAYDLVTRDCDHHNERQQFSFENGRIAWEAAGGDWCVNVDARTRAGAGGGGWKLTMWSQCWGGPHQTWRYDRDRQLFSSMAGNTEAYLDAALGGEVIVWRDAHGRDNQRWTMVQPPRQRTIASAGAGGVSLRNDNGACLQVSGSGTSASEYGLVAAACDSDNSRQRFIFNNNRISWATAGGNWCVNVDSRTSAGAGGGGWRLTMWSQCWGGPHQRWTYNIDRKLFASMAGDTEAYLDTSGTGDVNVWRDAHGRSNQRWTIVPDPAPTHPAAKRPAGPGGISFFVGADPQFGFTSNAVATGTTIPSMRAAAKLARYCSDCSKILGVAGDLSMDEPDYAWDYSKDTHIPIEQEYDIKVLDGLGNHDNDKFDDHGVSFNTERGLYHTGGLSNEAQARRTLSEDEKDRHARTVPITHGWRVYDSNRSAVDSNTKFSTDIAAKTGRNINCSGELDFRQKRHCSGWNNMRNCSSFVFHDAYYCAKGDLAYYYAVELNNPRDPSGETIILVQLHNDIYSSSSTAFLKRVLDKMRNDGKTDTPVVIMGHYFVSDDNSTEATNFKNVAQQLNLAAILHGHYGCTNRSTPTKNYGHCNADNFWNDVHRRGGRGITNKHGVPVEVIDTNSFLHGIFWAITVLPGDNQVRVTRLHYPDLKNYVDALNDSKPLRELLFDMRGAVPDATDTNIRVNGRVTPTQFSCSYDSRGNCKYAYYH